METLNGVLSSWKIGENSDPRNAIFLFLMSVEHENYVVWATRRKQLWKQEQFTTFRSYFAKGRHNQKPSPS